MIDIITINERLIEYYGRDVSINKPNFRIVWTTSELEICYREFALFTEDGTFLRNEKGISQGKKYELPFQQDKWVLERLVSTTGNPYLENVTPWSYEPIWIFGCGKSDPNPVWRAVKLLVDDVLKGKKEFLTHKDVERLEKKAIEEEKKLFKTMLQNDSPYIPGAIHAGSAIVVPTNYEKKGN